MVLHPFGVNTVGYARHSVRKRRRRRVIRQPLTSLRDVKGKPASQFVGVYRQDAKRQAGANGFAFIHAVSLLWPSDEDRRAVGKGKAEGW